MGRPYTVNVPRTASLDLFVIAGSTGSGNSRGATTAVIALSHCKREVSVAVVHKVTICLHAAV